MNEKEYRAFLDLLMCSDPWPIKDGGKNHKILEAFANKEATKFGHEDWIVAYHRLEAEEI